MKYLILSLFFLGSLHTIAQTTNIGGIINQYSKVTSIDKCKNEVTVDDTGPFAVGDTVLIIQMSGANINTSNTSFYGNIDFYNGSGNYELAHIAAISGSVITFKNVLLRNYEANGAVQLVTVPTYVNANITSLLTCQPWNGSTGGVCIARAINKITISNTIDVSGKGFRGADTLSDDCFNSGFGGSSDYRCNRYTFCGARKGEGISAADTNNIYGKGPMANGGGGGNDHNSGGGGGGNYGAGGLGGDRINASMFSCPGGNPGIGGRALQYDIVNNKIFLGGGGGAGDGNNYVNTKGGNGGGIVILYANEIEANNVSILSKGDTVRGVAAGDAAGGGGAGGTVVLRANTFSTTNLNINVDGGKGGNVNNGFDPAANRCMGPGGGGGGGAVWFSSVSTPVGCNVSALGGATGITSWPGAHVSCALLSNGGRDGDVGGVLNDLVSYEGTQLYAPHLFSVCCDTTICRGDQVILSASQSGTTPISYFWNTGETSSSILVSPFNTYTYICTGTDALGCIISDSAIITVNAINLGVYAAPSDTVLEGTLVTLNAIIGSRDTILWTPSTGLSNINSLNPTFTADSSIIYCAYGETASGCRDTDCVSIYVIQVPDTIIPENIAFPDAFTPNGDGNNDFYQVIYRGSYDIQEFSIFNRWGEVVYSSSDLNQGWNGKFMNQDQSIGTYVYYLLLKDSQGTLTPKKYTGTITLIR